MKKDKHLCYFQISVANEEDPAIWLFFYLNLAKFIKDNMI